MATARYGHKTSLETKAFRAAEAIMREDPVLADPDKVKNWGFMRGQLDVGVYTPQPPIGMMPLIRAYPGHRTDRPAGRSSETAIVIDLQLFVPGSDADDILDLWGAVREAWVGSRPFRDTTVKCFLQEECGAINFDVTVPGFGSYRTRDDLLFLSGVGQVELLFFRPR